MIEFALYALIFISLCLFLTSAFLVVMDFLYDTESEQVKDVMMMFRDN